MRIRVYAGEEAKPDKLIYSNSRSKEVYRSQFVKSEVIELLQKNGFCVGKYAFI